MKGDVLQGTIRAKFATCICTSCKRGRCELGLASLPSRFLLIIDADKYKRCCNFGGRLCDHIVFYLKGGTIVAVVELKSGLVKARVARRQIENGSKVAEQIAGSRRVSNFLPILLHGRPMHYLEVKILRRARVPFQGRNYMIVIERCGSQLREILRQYPAS